MKIKEGFMLHEVGGEYIVVAVGRASAGFNGVIKLNDTCAEIWKLIEQGLDENGIAQKLCERYDVDGEKALADVRKITEKLAENGVLE